jgi:hypothetical protein
MPLALVWLSRPIARTRLLRVRDLNPLLGVRFLHYDVERVKGRLAIRENGRCTLGFGEFERTEVLSHART